MAVAVFGSYQEYEEYSRKVPESVPLHLINVDVCTLCGYRYLTCGVFKIYLCFLDFPHDTF